MNRLLPGSTQDPQTVVGPSGERLQPSIEGATFTRRDTLVTADTGGDVDVWPSLLLADTLTPFHDEICSRLAQNLTAAQWRNLVGTAEPYDMTCRH